MYLKSVDMYGFKSFANKIVFKFDEGITAIVGPNGSGKSNIADAVRWVLGEQSAKNLRGSNMKDVIFAGTEARRPLGYCQVDLTIDNADKKMAISFSEVTVSRRVYRSGESEYYINGTACRLKDVHELFMDTGVGKEGYSIIGQGQVDKILSNKPDDRRGLFDEAAGIVKYKKRKVNAEKQLEEEEQNLVRINDIIRELEGQEISLKEQSEVAKEYLGYKEELKKQEVNIFVNELDSMDKRISNISEKEGVVYDQISSAKQSKELLNDQQQDIIKELESIDQKIDENQQASLRMSVEKEQRESKIQVTKEQINSIKANMNRINSENEQLNLRISRKKNELSDYEKQVKAVKATSDEQTKALEACEMALEALANDIRTKEDKVEELQSDMIERLNEISTTKSSILRFNTMLENLSERKAVLLLNHKDSSDKITAANEEATIKQADLEALSKLITEKEVESQAVKNKYRKLMSTRDALVQELNELKSKKNENESKLKALKDISEAYEGYQYAVKSVMNLKSSNKALGEGVLGVVADIIGVEKAYEKAIETALGANIQNIITDNEHTAKTLINYLKENRFGRGTFLPMTTIKAQAPTEQISSGEIGFLGYGNELVSCDSRYSHILDYLLGRVGIVKDLDAGIRISRKHKSRVRLVTLAGEVINPGGSMTGGAYKKDGNQFLARKRQIEELEVGIKKSDKAISLKDKEHNQLIKEIDLLNKKQAYYAEEQQQNNLDFNRLAIELKQLENNLTQLKQDHENAGNELSQLKEQEQTLTKNVKELEESLEGTEGLNKSQEDSVSEMLQIIEDYKVKRSELSEELTGLKVSASSSQGELNFVKENRDRVLNELEDLNSNLIKNNESIMSCEEEITQKSLLITKFMEATGDSDQDIKEAEALVKKLNQDKHRLSETREALYVKREAVTDEINQLDKELIRLQNQKEKLEQEKQDQSVYMWNEYEVTVNNAADYHDDSLGTLTDMRKAIKSLRQSIKDLGPVNVNAIEEYKAVHERYEFLTVQRDDLNESKEKIEELIEELKNDMETQFRQKFKQISKKFSEVFKELFGGGKAFLELIDDDNILEAGIDIIAQPPGKKLQSMRLLSGGEKAFTAISLLFAIQSLKPSPFCVLDEIEAALDDVNVVRFANYLKKLTKNTQFIIITHRKGTMEAADALYGITMQEKGISTQVSVKMLEETLD